MGVDEAGHDDRVAGVDDLGVASTQVLADFRDDIVVDEDVGATKIAHLPLQAEHTAALEQDPTHRSALSPLMLRYEQ